MRDSYFGIVVLMICLFVFGLFLYSNSSIKVMYEKYDNAAREYRELRLEIQKQQAQMMRMVEQNIELSTEVKLKGDLDAKKKRK